MVYRLFFFITILIFQPFFSFADEVGNKMFVVKPIAKPIYITKSGTKIYPCNGFINKKLIPIIYNELVMISKANKVSPPDGKICHYKIGKLNLGKTSLTLYSVDMYVNKTSMMSCVTKNYCTDFRTMNFKAKNKKLHRQYMITNTNTKLMKMVCISNSGKIVNAKGGC